MLEPGEILLGVSLPPQSQSMRSAYRKVRARRSWDFALAGVALALDFDGDTIRKPRVVLSGAAPIPWRSTAVEQAITGRKLDPETVKAASEVIVKDAVPLEHNAYKLPLFRAVIQEGADSYGSELMEGLLEPIPQGIVYGIDAHSRFPASFLNGLED